MKKIFSKTKTILDEELSLINEKIKGSTFLEILKFKILNRLKEEITHISTNEISEPLFKYNYEDDFKKILIQLEYFKSIKKDQNMKIDKNLLLISICENIIVEILDINSDKFIKINLNPLTGINLPEKSTIKLNIPKNAVVLQFYLENKNIVVENLK